MQKLDPAAKVPVRAYEHDAGLDLFSLERHTLVPGEGRIFKTGIALEIEPGFVGLVWDRSSMGKRGIKTLGGVIDSGYRGEVGVILWNLSRESQEIMAGDKIAQLLIQPIATPQTKEGSGDFRDFYARDSFFVCPVFRRDRSLRDRSGAPEGRATHRGHGAQ
ncbi:dUTP diphosphatase [bacterium]|nr:dUTP diphosphatase [bacterium]